ncbi:hypothetical protein RvY_01512 [Ramazzottius varieornatus]|uniref:SH3 domain-containing protein n=1 Tax=Ramazzottius varieornatus TaxID=947166 RepID=A0A1D1UGK7_RAMVA|nr:hypothetical protein RvY_01512 [Ramazzottius varieornatus]
MSSATQDVLVRMGFPLHRAEKAVVNTGDISVQAALDWILSHKDDPSLDSNDNREYVVYLCPAGVLAGNIQDFRAKSADLCGKNGAFRHMPHVTICPAFRVDAASVPVIIRAMDHAHRSLEERDGLPQKVRVDLHGSEREPFVGLFVDENSDKAAKEFLRVLLDQAHSLIAPDREAPVVLSTKRYHLTLAHSFPPEQRQAIMKLAQSIPLKNRAGWYFLLLSRDPRFNGHEVYRMYYPWESSPARTDELSFTPDDYVYISPNELDRNQSGSTAWVRGTSWSTGKTGLVPLNGLTRCVDSDLWILHRSVPFLKDETVNSEAVERLCPAAQRKRWVETERRSHTKVHPAVRSSTELHNGTPQPLLHDSFQYDGIASGSSSTSTLYVMRHGERMDFVFGMDWIKTCFDATTGSFTRSDLNMPKSLPKRKDGPLAYASDPPLTSVGVLQAQITGKAMKDAGVSFNRVFVSPALRSIQTATAVVEACCDQKPVKLCVEPGLYEWLGWVRSEHPAFLPPAELHSFGIPVDPEYIPIFPMDQLDYDEDVKSYYRRNGHVAKRVVEKYGHEGGNILLVGHASSLDTCTRRLRGYEPRTHMEMNRITQKVPYCAVITCVPNADKNVWVLRSPPFPTFTHGANVKFSANILQSGDEALPTSTLPGKPRLETLEAKNPWGRKDGAKY